MSPWLPTLVVIALTAVALTEVGSSTGSPKNSRLWMTTISPEALNKKSDGPMVSALKKQIRVLEDQIKELQVIRQTRTITSDTADKLTEYLRQFGGRRVVVSCIPDDIEAYQYANQHANVLKAANWNAQG